MKERVLAFEGVDLPELKHWRTGQTPGAAAIPIFCLPTCYSRNGKAQHNRHRRRMRLRRPAIALASSAAQPKPPPCHWEDICANHVSSDVALQRKLSVSKGFTLFVKGRDRGSGHLGNPPPCSKEEETPGFLTTF
jgi:hypothetical protein